MTFEPTVSTTSAATKTFAPKAQWVDRLTNARAALAHVIPRFLGLLRSAQRPDVIAVGEWRVADVAAHMGHVSAGELMLAKSVGSSNGAGLPRADDIIAAASQFNAASLESDQERDPSVLADRIEQSLAEFIDTMTSARGDEPVTWLGGVVLPSAALACHLLEELLVHGFDIARAEQKPWPIEPGHAALGFGFIIDLLRFSNSDIRRAFVDQDAATGVRAVYDFEMRGARRDFLILEDGLVTVEDPSSRLVDCHVSADPVVALLVGMGRIGRIKPALTGRMTAWGRKPWLAFRLNSLLRNP
jgi:uncharacterized protein (TIGR03083 family)